MKVASALPPRRVRTVRARGVDASKRLPIRARMIVEEQAHGGSADAGLCSRSHPEDRAKTANKMNGLDRKFCIAPMMDWTETAGGSMTWRRECAKFAHVRSPFLLLSFLSGRCARIVRSTIGRAMLRNQSLHWQIDRRSQPSSRTRR